MTVDVSERELELVAYWRTGVGEDNPAGPLFSSGRHAEADLVAGDTLWSATCGTTATYCHPNSCC